MQDQGTKTITEIFVYQFVCRFGTPMQIHSDQGGNFQSKIFGEVCEL
jgi:hypothetical protein